MFVIFINFCFQLGQDYSNEVIENKYRSDNTAKRNDTKNIHSLPSVSKVSNLQDNIHNYEKQIPLRTSSSAREKLSGQSGIKNEIIHSNIIDLTKDTESDQDLESNEVIKKSDESFSTKIFVNSKIKNSKFSRRIKKSKNVAISSIMKQKENTLNEENIKGVDDHQNPPDIPMDVTISGKNSPRLNSKTSDSYMCGNTLEEKNKTVQNRTKNQDNHITEVNSMDKVKLWLNSDSTTKQYGQQLRKMEPRALPSKPEKFTSNSETVRLYEELMKNKDKSPVPNNNEKSKSNDLWDYIAKKM